MEFINKVEIKNKGDLKYFPIQFAKNNRDGNRTVKSQIPVKNPNVNVKSQLTELTNTEIESKANASAKKITLEKLERGEYVVGVRKDESSIISGQWGLFADKDIKKHTVLGILSGTIVKRDKDHDLPQNLKFLKDHLVQGGPEIDSEKYDTLACNPLYDWLGAVNEPLETTAANCFAQYYPIKLGKWYYVNVMVMIAGIDIKKDDEITWLYGSSYDQRDYTPGYQPDGWALDYQKLSEKMQEFCKKIGLDLHDLGWNWGCGPNSVPLCGPKSSPYPEPKLVNKLKDEINSNLYKRAKYQFNEETLDDLLEETLDETDQTQNSKKRKIKTTGETQRIFNTQRKSKKRLPLSLLKKRKKVPWN